MYWGWNDFLKRLAFLTLIYMACGLKGCGECLWCVLHLFFCIAGLLYADHCVVPNDMRGPGGPNIIYVYTCTLKVPVGRNIWTGLEQNLVY